MPKYIHSNTQIYIHKDTCTNTDVINMYMHTYIHRHRFTHIYTYMHTYIYIYRERDRQIDR